MLEIWGRRSYIFYKHTRKEGHGVFPIVDKPALRPFPTELIDARGSSRIADVVEIVIFLGLSLGFTWHDGQIPVKRPLVRNPG